MQMSKSKCDLGNQEPCLLLIEALYSSQVSEQLPSPDEVHDEIDSKVVLEHVIHAHDERVLNSIEDILLQLETFKKVLIDYHIFSDALHSV